MKFEIVAPTSGAQLGNFHVKVHADGEEERKARGDGIAVW
jgi:hypothetical protein